MSQQKFVDRDEERDFLEDRYRSRTSELIVLYGRRRVGKTELLVQFLRDKTGVYYLASEEGDAANIREFSRYIARLLGDQNFARVRYESWAAIFETLLHHERFVALSGKEKVVIVLDEFPSLIAHNKAIPSIFQKMWDEFLKKAPLMLILAGSSVSTMETAVLGYASPLYGRRTGQWQVEPLEYRHLQEFLPYPQEEIAMTWFVLGGIPGYLLQFDPGRGFWENVEHSILRKGAYLYSEAEILMNYEFREPANYMSIFRAVAGGCTSLARICNETGLDKSMVSKYLHVLTRLHIVQEEIPVTSPPTFRRRHYRIVDPYLNFWFRYVYPNRIDLESRRTPDVLDVVKATFPMYGGEMFEQLAGELVRKGRLFPDRRFTRIGRWWHGEEEIDLICLDESSGEIVFCECKWSNLDSRSAYRILADLQRKAVNVRWRNEERKENFCLIGKNIEGKAEIHKEGFLVYDVHDLARPGTGS